MSKQSLSERLGDLALHKQALGINDEAALLHEARSAIDEADRFLQVLAALQEPHREATAAMLKQLTREA